MADRIKGITVEINGDTSKLSDALRGVDKNLKDTQKQLKDVNSALKLDPKNVELLRQKQRLLNDAVADSSKKLDILKKAQADAAKEMEGGSEEARKNYDRLTIEIAKAEANMKKLQDQARQTNDQLNEADKGKLSNLKDNLDKAADAAGKAGDKIAGIGEKASVASGLVLALGAAALTAFQEVDEGADTIIKKTGATGEAAAELQSVYEEVASNVKTTFEDAGAAVGEINTRWGATGDELRDLATEFIKFADINDQDVNGAIVGVDKAMKTFNVDSSKTTAVMGLLTKTAQNTGISVGTLEGLLQTNGAALMEMGLGLGESVQLMGALERSGADVSSVMAGLKKAATEYSKSGEDMSSGLQDLISRLQDSSTTAEATEEAYTIFGSRAGLAFVSLAKQGKINLGNLEGDFKGYESVVSNTYEATQDGTDKLAITANRTKIALGKLGATLSDAVAPILDDINDLIQDAVEWLNGLSDEEKKQILRIGGIAAIAGPTITMLGKGIKGVSLLLKGLTSPLGLAVAGLTGVVAGVTALTNAYWENAKAEYGLKGAMKEVVDAAIAERDAWNEVKEARDNSFSTIQSEYEQTSGLWEELQKITDENGNIKQGYEDRAAAITGILAEALGVEAQAVGTVIQGYDKLREAAETSLEKQRLDALLRAQSTAYGEATLGIEKQKALVEDLGKQAEDAQDAWVKATAEYGAYSAEATTAQGVWEDITQRQIPEQLATLGEMQQTIDAYEIANRAALNGTAQDWQNAAKIMVDAASRSTQEYYNIGTNIYTEAVRNGERYAYVIKTREGNLIREIKTFQGQTFEETRKIDKTLSGISEKASEAGSKTAGSMSDAIKELPTTIESAVGPTTAAATRLFQPINNEIDKTMQRLSTLGIAMSGTLGAHVSVTNNNTLTLDGKVVARSVNTTLGKTIGRYSR